MPLVALDFDGVLNTYMGWKGERHLADIRPGAKEFLQELKRRGYSLCIFTCRDTVQVRDWLQKFGLSALVESVTNNKPPATVYVDDRGLTFQGDYQATLKQIDEFQPYWRQEQWELKVEGAQTEAPHPEPYYVITPKGTLALDLARSLERMRIEERRELSGRLMQIAQQLHEQANPLRQQSTYFGIGCDLADACIMLGLLNRVKEGT